MTAAIVESLRSKLGGESHSPFAPGKLVGAEQREIEPHAIDQLFADVELDREATHHARRGHRLGSLDAPRAVEGDDPRAVAEIDHPLVTGDEGRGIRKKTARWAAASLTDSRTSAVGAPASLVSARARRVKASPRRSSGQCWRRASSGPFGSTWLKRPQGQLPLIRSATAIGPDRGKILRECPLRRAESPIQSGTSTHAAWSAMRVSARTAPRSENDAERTTVSFVAERGQPALAAWTRIWCVRPVRGSMPSKLACAVEATTS